MISQRCKRGETMNIKEKNQQEAITKLRGLSPADKELAEESTGLATEEMVLGIEQGGKKEGLIYGAVIVTADGSVGIVFLFIDSIAALLILSIDAVGELTVLTGDAVKKFLEEHLSSEKTMTSAVIGIETSEWKNEPASCRAIHLDEGGFPEETGAYLLRLISQGDWIPGTVYGC